MKNAREYIIFALDLPTAHEAKSYIELLSGHVGMFKVGLELFIRSGPEIVSHIHEKKGAGVFLDLKLHDIPATVARSMSVIAKMGVKFATVHCGQSQRMLEAAVDGANGAVGVLGVTVLTSVSEKDLEMAGYKAEFCENIGLLALKRAEAAKRAGFAGVVCSAREVSLLKKRLGDQFIAVTPGIRPTFEIVEGDDQKRVWTPADAVKNGADFLVIGRPIRDSGDPVMAAKKIASEIEQVL